MTKNDFSKVSEMTWNDEKTLFLLFFKAFLCIFLCFPIVFYVIFGFFDFLIFRFLSIFSKFFFSKKWLDIWTRECPQKNCMVFKLNLLKSGPLTNSSFGWGYRSKYFRNISPHRKSSPEILTGDPNRKSWPHTIPVDPCPLHLNTLMNTLMKCHDFSKLISKSPKSHQNRSESSKIAQNLDFVDNVCDISTTYGVALVFLMLL